MGCVASKAKTQRRLLSRSSTSTCTSEDDYSEEHSKPLHHSNLNFQPTWNVLHQAHTFTLSDSPTHLCVCDTQSKSFTRFPSPQCHSVIAVLTIPTVLNTLLSYLTSSDSLHFYHFITHTLDHKRDTLMSSSTDVECHEHYSDFSLDSGVSVGVDLDHMDYTFTYTTDSDNLTHSECDREDDECTCHSSVVDGDDDIDLYHTAPTHTTHNYHTDHMSHSDQCTRMNEEACSLFQVSDNSPVSHAISRVESPWKETWLLSPFLTTTTTTTHTCGVYADDIPMDALHVHPVCESTAAVSLTPHHLVQYHHQHPLATTLHLPRLRYSGTVVAVSCFTHLRHLTIGCIGFQPDCSVTDYDIAVVVDTLAHSLESVHLLKLNELSSASIAMITTHCYQVTSLVAYACEGMRTHERYWKNSLNVQKAFESFEETDAPVIPRIFKPLSHTGADVDTQVIQTVSSLLTQKPVVRRLELRCLELLDMRYSMDMNDDILTEIMTAFDEITIFMASNTSGVDFARTPATTATANTNASLEISDVCWDTLVKHYESSAKLLYIDDSMRESINSFQGNGRGDPILFHMTSSVDDCTCSAVSGGGREEAVWALTPPPSPQCHRLMRTVAAITATLPSYLDPEIFCVPGSE